MSLSDVLWFKGRYIEVEDVKQAIKELKEDLRSCQDVPNATRGTILVLNYALMMIDIIFGDKLK